MADSHTKITKKKKKERFKFRGKRKANKNNYDFKEDRSGMKLNKIHIYLKKKVENISNYNYYQKKNRK